MRKTITSVMLLIFASEVIVQAGSTGIELISQTYTATGGYDGILGSDSYEIISPTGAIGDILGVQSSAQGFPTFESYPPTHHGLIVWLNTTIDYVTEQDSWASAVSEVTFRPLEPLLRIKANVWIWCSPYGQASGNFLLKDLTTGETLLDDDAPWFSIREFDVDPSHEYYLKTAITGQVSTGIIDDWKPYWVLYQSGANIYLNPIPVPVAILLGSIGIGCVTWLRRRKTL